MPYFFLAKLPYLIMEYDTSTPASTGNPPTLPIKRFTYSITAKDKTNTHITLI